MDAYLAALPADREIVLLPHSNAGLVAPLLASARRVAGYVFVDAGLPPASGAVPVAASHLLSLLAEKADVGGLLPRWTAWWGQSESDALFPNDAIRARVESQQLQLPLSYFAETLEIPVGWDDRPSAYLSFGNTYAKERENAATRGWTVGSIPGTHLHMLIDPVGVADAIHDLLGQIGIKPEPANLWPKPH